MGRSIITPVNLRSVHQLADELPFVPEPHLRNQGSARARRRPRRARRARRVPCAPRARTRTLLPDCHAPGKPPTPHLNRIWRTGRSFCPSASLMIPPRGTGQAPRRGVRRRSARPFIPLPAPPLYTYKQWHARSACLSTLITAPPPLPRQCGHAVVDPAPQTLPNPGAHPSHPPPL